MMTCPHCQKEHDPVNHFCPITGQPIPMSERMVGQALLGKYEIISFLGPWFAGGTFRVRREGDGGTLYVAKMVHPQFSKNTTELGIFRDTVEKWMNVEHPNVARVYEIGKDDAGVPVIVRENLEGLHLQEVFLKENVTFDLPVASYILHGILEAMTVLHEAGVKSGRMTASDVFMIPGEGDRMVVKVGDFGEYLLESLLGDAGEANPYVKLYKAPEQVREGTTEYASDIFAAGVIHYRLLTGRFPYPDGIPDKPEKVPAFVSAVEVKPELPSVVDYNLRRAMAIFPRDRFKNAAAFVKTLTGFLPEKPVLYSEVLKAASIAPEAVKARAAQAPVVQKSARPRMDTIKFDQHVAVPPPEIASATTQQFDATVPTQLKEAIERHSSPDSPPAAVPVPFDSRPDAWKEERKLVPRSSKTPSKPPPAMTGVPLEVPAPAPAPVKVPEPQRPAAVRPAPPAPRSAVPTQPSKVSRAALPAAPQEESLAPIMPTRYAKWVIIGGGALILLLVVWGVKSMFFPGGGDGGSSGRKGATAADTQSTEEEESASTQEGPADGGAQEEAAAAAADAAQAPDEEEATGLLAGLVEAADAAQEPEVPADAAPEAVKIEKVVIKLNVAPTKSTVYFDGEKASKPFKFTVEKSDREYAVRVEKDGYEPWESTVTAGEDRSINVSLTKLPPPEPEVKPEVKPEEKPEADATAKPTEKKIKKGGGKKKGKKSSGLVEDVPF
jgi:serine/threonine protein kinase